MEAELACPYKETRVNLEPASTASIVQIRLPSPAQGRFRDRRVIAADKYAEEERVYRSKNLATATSIYHRKHHDSPRSFLWRVLEDDTVLSIRAVDVCKQQDAVDANLILHLRFPNPIRPSCIALADPAEHDTLHVFVLDQTNHFHTIILRPDHFRKRSTTENGVGDACTSYLASTFSFKHPHRLVAVGANQVAVTLHDGGLIKFERTRPNDAGSYMWKDVIFTAQGWAEGLRSLVPFPFQGSQTIKYGKVSMDLSAATSIAADSLGVENAQFLFTVCLDHRLRIWNVRTGSILYNSDLLNGGDRPPQEIGKWIIDPSHTNLVRIVGESERPRLLVTYSPVGAGEFKFWKVNTHEESTVFVHDMFPDRKFVPPAPSSDEVWTLADFGVSQPSGGIHLWTLWKNNMTYRTQKLEFDSEITDLFWNKEWLSVHVDGPSPYVESSGSCDAIDSTEKWLDLIFYPGRFSKSSLETALAMYERGLGASKEVSPRSGKSLAEAICSVLGSTAILSKAHGGGVDYEQFRSAGEIQWRRFYRLVIELDKLRGEALSLALDPESGIAWVLCADLVAAMRQCTTLDQLYHNAPSPDMETENAKLLISAGLEFYNNLPEGIIQQCIAALRIELYEDSGKTDAERIQFFFDKSGFWRGVSDEDAGQVVEELGKDFRIVTHELYRQLLELFATTEDARSREIRHPLTEFGRKVVVKSVQEEAALQWQILMSQLLLLVHMQFEFDEDNDEHALHTRLDVGIVYRNLIEALRRLELVRWLTKTEITVPLLKSERSSGSASPVTSKRGDETQTVTAFEGHVSHLLGLVDMTGEPLASSLTDLVMDICAPDSGIELSPVLIQSSLLKRDRPDLALELSPHCDQDPFSTYIQGRVFLSLKDNSTAALYFKKAAVGMSVELRNADRHSGGLLDDTEWNLLNSGLANYYSHIVSLYDRKKAFSYVIDFARLSLQFAPKPSDHTVRLEMLSRLFTASTSISRFDLAHATLLSMTDRALQQSCLKKLVERMCETAQAAELITLPFSGLQEEVDGILLQKCRNTTEVMRGTPYHKILYAWRINHNDYRGAAATLHDRLQKLRQTGEADKLTGDDMLDTPVTKQFLMLINALSCVDSKQAWITTDDLLSAGARNGGIENHNPKRKVVTLADLRKQYQAELDRIAAIQNNQFGLTEEEDVMVIDD